MSDPGGIPGAEKQGSFPHLAALGTTSNERPSGLDGSSSQSDMGSEINANSPGSPTDESLGGEPVSQRAALFRLIAIVAIAIGLGAMTHELALLVVIAAVVAIVMLHEAGHMVMAKRAHMKVTEYFLGFGPRVWSFKRGETTYGVKAIPAGGYVRIVGMTNLEEVDPKDEDRTYRQASFPRKISVVVAGSTVHFLLSFILIWAILVFAGIPSSTGVEVVGLPSVSGARSPAVAAGLRPGDQILAIDGHPVTSPGEAAQRLSDAVPNQALKLELERDGRKFETTLTPVPAAGVRLAGAKPPPGARSVIGVELYPPVVHANPILGVGTAGVDLVRAVGEVFGFFGKFFSIHGLSTYFHEVTSPTFAAKASKKGVERPESIIGAVNTATQAARAGPADLALVLVSLNLFLGIFNMVPLLPLDGGHVAIAVYERIRSRKGRKYHADAAKLMPVTYAVLMALVFLGLSAAYLDITHPVANPFH
ncbi:MAG: RIP metalloprotease [Actinobacteria bacterium]|nr:RIP metalloprotease [Actinomycetota bacterium]